MTLSQFISKYNNQGVDVDGAYGYQCMDLMHRYIIDCLGLGVGVLAAPTAYQAYLAGDAHFDKIPNSPTGVPQPGDIVFWNTTVGSAGHVAIFISGDASQFTSFDQNWPVNSYAHSQHHTYNGVAGWLRMKGATNNQGGNMDPNSARIQDLQKIGRTFEGIDPDSGFDYSGWVGQPLQKVLDDWWGYENTGKYLAKVEAALAVKPPPPPDPNSVTVTKDTLWAKFKQFLGL